MAAKKDIEEAVADEAAPDVVVEAPGKPLRNDKPNPNSTFAERAKAKGRNKRVDVSESK